MVVGVAAIGISVGLMRLAALGLDPYTGMNYATSRLLGLNFGSWQLVVNLLLLVVVFLRFRKLIGLGTVINMVAVGYIADFVAWLARDLSPAIWHRGLLLATGCVIMSLGAALYMVPEMGVSPYDAVALMLVRNRKVSFRVMRIATDATCVVVAVLMCLLGSTPWHTVVNAGTIITALFTGPLIQFFRTSVAEPLYRKGHFTKTKPE